MKGLSRENTSPSAGCFHFSGSQPRRNLILARSPTAALALSHHFARTALDAPSALRWLVICGGCQPIVLSETLCGLLLSPVVRGGIQLGVVLELHLTSCSGTQLIVILPLEPLPSLSGTVSR
jgi:hypothetical protein